MCVAIINRSNGDIPLWDFTPTASMKIEKMKLSSLRNEEHTQLVAELVALLTKAEPAQLHIEVQVNNLKKLWADENQALLVVRKSATSDLMVDANIERGNIYRGVAGAVKSSVNHFNADKQAAAKRVAILLSQYGNVAAKPYNEETVIINKLLAEAKGAYKADFDLLGLTDWMIELELKNNAFDQLVKSRYDEVSGKTDLKMREVRTQVDTAIRELVDRLNALVLINGIEGYQNLISDINTRFEKFEQLVLQRQGRAAKSKTVVEVK